MNRARTDLPTKDEEEVGRAGIALLMVFAPLIVSGQIVYSCLWLLASALGFDPIEQE